MKKGFTLIELLVVVGIMGLLGTISVGGYRQAQQGMEERGVIQNVDQFVRSAFQRARIDRKPTGVHFWNELIREESPDGDETLVVVGKAVAIRQVGRLSRIVDGVLIDEFGDLEQFDEIGNYADAPQEDETIRLWQINGSTLAHSSVRAVPVTPNGKNNGGQRENFVTHNPVYDMLDHSTDKGMIIQYGYRADSAGGGNASWYVGAPYCMEFQSIVLPRNYIFGSTYPTTLSAPVMDADDMVFGMNGGGATIEIYALRPGANGALTSVSIGRTRNPSQEQSQQ